MNLFFAKKTAYTKILKKLRFFKKEIFSKEILSIVFLLLLYLPSNV